MNILEWINKDNCGKFLFTSSSEAYAGTIAEYGDYKDYIPSKEDIPLCINDVSNPRFSYGGSKLIGEILTVNLLNVKNIDFSIVRYHNIYGPRMGFDHVIPEFSERVFNKINPFPIFGGTETRAFCFISDAVNATKLVMRSEKTNKEIVHVGNSEEEIKIIDMAKLLFKVSNFNTDIDVKEAPKGSVSRRCPDTTKLKELTGYYPKVFLEEGLKTTYNWYEEVFKERE
jgi:nucleoside-diphosphate-sugar epimerase